jgi:hypothetical protein
MRVRLNSKDAYTSWYEATGAARKLLPLLRSRLRKDDKLPINGPGIMTSVIRAEQQGAELVAKRIQETVQATSVRLNMREWNSSKSTRVQERLHSTIRSQALKGLS